MYPGPDASTVTQVTDGLPSSSLSCAAVVVAMLDSLWLEEGQRVLELGCGAGWNAALLSARTGPGQVTSVEVDATLAADAEEHLTAAGAQAAVRVGDGPAGWTQDAPYDRVIATYAVEEVPWARVEQTRPGGRIVTPWGRLGHAALTVADDGRSASGWMQGLGMFMPARGTSQDAPFHHIRDRHPLEAEGPFPRSLKTLTGPEGGHLLFALRVLLPEVHLATEIREAGITAWLHDGRSSWATLVSPADSGPAAVAYRGGPRRLADETARAWEMWEQRGAPGLYDFGLTPTENEQWIWSDAPGGPRWYPLGVVPVR